MNKVLFFVLLCICNVSKLNAQVSKTVSCVAGQLGNLLTFNEKSSITHLVVTGVIDQRDFATMNSMQALTDIDISDVLVSAYYGSFEVFPANTIPNSAFWGNERLQTIKLPYSISVIDRISFYSCLNLISVSIPNSVTLIGSNAFNSCKKLARFDAPISLENIGDGAFGNCVELTSVFIPASVCNIGKSVFLGCYSLKSISVDPANINYMVDNDVLFNKDKSILICYPAAKSDLAYEIPTSVTYIAEYAFTYSLLQSIIIPNTVEEIGIYGFAGCGNLKEIYSYSTIPAKVSSDVFKYLNFSRCKLYVPKGYNSFYQSAEQWKNFENIIEFIPTSIENTELKSKLSVCFNVLSARLFIEGFEGFANLVIYDIFGKVVLEQQICNNSVDVHNLFKGVYVVRVSDEKGYVQKKFIKN